MGLTPRLFAAAVVLVALGAVVFFFHVQPLPQPPPYGGSAHPWLATLGMSGILAGAVFSRSPWARAAGWSAAVALLIFETGFGASRLPGVVDVPLSPAPRRWADPLRMGFLFGAAVFLGQLPLLLKKSSG